MIVKSIADWVLPVNVKKLIKLAYKFMVKTSERDLQKKAILNKNTTFKNKHKNERVFILGSGPSINKQDLCLLKDEITFSLNSFYLHPENKIISPHYHFISGLAVHPHMADIATIWFNEIDEKILKPTILFMNWLDYKFITSNQFLTQKKVFYLSFKKWLGKENTNPVEIDASKDLYLGNNVGVMALQMALYMGFTKIYLIGFDHDWILRYSDKQSTHFYEPGKSVIEKSGKTDWNVNNNWHRLFQENAHIWNQYILLNNYAIKNSIEIINCTEGGILDVFPCKRLIDVI